MIEIIVNLDKNSRRPIAEIDWFDGCLAMVDTGALFPIWTSTDDALIELGAKLQMKDVSFGGFGGRTQGNLYRVNFKLNNIIYVDMPIIAKEMNDLSCHMIISATMFEKMIYTIDDIDKKLEIRIPDNQIVRNLRLSNEKGGISVYLAGTYEAVEEYTAYKSQNHVS